MALIQYLLLFSPFFYLYSDHYPYREISSPIISLEENCRVLVITPFRTGSTLIFNVIRYLFENELAQSKYGKVSKWHSVPDIFPTDIIITTIRDPLSICASLSHLPGKHLYFPPLISELEGLRGQCKYLILFKYEEFANDHFEYIFDLLEKTLGIEIPSHQKEYIQTSFCISSVKKIQDRYTDFSQYDQITNIHGNHIHHSDWEKDFTKEEAKALYEEHYNLRKVWGYPDIDFDKIYSNDKG